MSNESIFFFNSAPKAGWIPEAPRHFEESQWGPSMWASEDGESVGGRDGCASTVNPVNVISKPEWVFKTGVCVCAPKHSRTMCTQCFVYTTLYRVQTRYLHALYKKTPPFFSSLSENFFRSLNSDVQL